MGAKQLRGGRREPSAAGEDRPSTVGEQSDDRIELTVGQVCECRLETADERVAGDVEKMIAALLRRAPAIEAKRRVDARGRIALKRAL